MDETKRCPFCGEIILQIAIKCKHCGSMLAELSQPTSVDLASYTKLALSAKYEILSEIGRGGMATVYKATQKNLGRTVALKVIHQNHLHDKELVDRFHREARVSAQLKHENIITIYDEGIENGVHYMSMEFLEGIDLHRKVKEKGPLDYEELVRILIPIADALDYSHKNGLVHRDVKSANIFLTKNGRPVLMDFGIAHANTGTQLTMSGTVLGTPEFMSPEQADGKEVDGKSDIYSLGVVAYFGLTGKLPYSAENPLVTISKILNEGYVPISKIKPFTPEWLVSIIDGCLIKDKRNRIQNGGELIRLLKEKRIIKKTETGSLQSLYPDQFTVKIDTEKKKIIADEIKKPLHQPETVKTDDILQSKPKTATSHKTVPSNSSSAPTVIGIAIMIAAIFLIILLTNKRKPDDPVQDTNSFELENNYNPPQQTNYEPPKQEPIVQKKSEIIEEELITVPDVVGSTQTLAERILRQKNFIIGAVIPISSNSENIGNVVRQFPKAGSRVKKGTSVNLWIGE